MCKCTEMKTDEKEEQNLKSSNSDMAETGDSYTSILLETLTPRGHQPHKTNMDPRGDEAERRGTTSLRQLLSTVGHGKMPSLRINVWNVTN